jgi:hypothetical protein
MSAALLARSVLRLPGWARLRGQQMEALAAHMMLPPGREVGVVVVDWSSRLRRSRASDILLGLPQALPNHLRYRHSRSHQEIYGVRSYQQDHRRQYDENSRGNSSAVDSQG